MSIKSQIRKIQNQIKTEKNRSKYRIEKLENELRALYEKDSEFKIGDRIRVSSVTVRDIHRDSDIEILGKEGNVTKIESGWITVSLDDYQCGNCFPTNSHCLTKVNRVSKYIYE